MDASSIRLIVAAMIFFCCFCLERTTMAFPLDSEESDEDDSYPTVIERMGMHLDTIPKGKFAVTTANFAYNQIDELPAFVFYVNLYKNVRTLSLAHNRIEKIDPESFREMRQLNTLDLSSNHVTLMDPNTFRHNGKLQKLDVAFNNITLDPEKPFLRSHSISSLILSGNQIIHVYDITFARLPNVRTLLLDGNPLYYLSKNCFVHIRHLQYISVANTGVYRLTSSMFRTVPRLVDINGTALARKFEPPLKKVRSGQLMKLMDIEKYILGEDYDT